MFKIAPTYSNFLYLEGMFESFVEDINFVFVLIPTGKSQSEKDLCNKIFDTIRDSGKNIRFTSEPLIYERADLSINELSNICKKIKRAGLIICDISFPDEKVYYMLGMACALDKRIILTYNPALHYCEHKDEKLVFDLHQFRSVEYQDFEGFESALEFKTQRTEVYFRKNSGVYKINSIENCS